MWLKFQHICLLLILVIGSPSLAHASDSAAIRNLINTGQYSAAQETASALATADGYALASEAMNGQILLGEVKDLNAAAKASLKLAQSALALDPNNANARLQEALADGFVTRTTGDFKAWRKKMPQKTFAKTTALREDYPDSARATALLAAWHLGVIRKTGINNGGKWFGASLEAGKNMYRRAMQMDPHDILIATNYYMSLSVIEEVEILEANKRKSLEAILKLPANNHIERQTKTQVAKMLQVLGDREAEVEIAENFLDGDWK